MMRAATIPLVSTRRVLAALGVLGVLALSAVGAAPATAADELDPVLRYSGSVTGADGQSYPFAATVDCSTGTCLLTATVAEGDVAFSLTGPNPLELTDGSVSADIAAQGDVCAETFVSAGPFSATATATAISGVRSGGGSAVVDCPDGGSTQYDPFTLSFDAPLVSGDACYLTKTCPSATPTPTPTATVEPVVTSATPPVAPNSPGSFSTLATVLDSARPGNLLWATILSVVLVILVAFPTHLLNAAVGTGTDRVSAWWRARRRPAAVVAAPAAAIRAWSGWPLAAVGVLAASLISSFADPGFGLNLSSPRVFLSILASFVLDAVLGWFIVIWLVRRADRTAVPTFSFAPATLLIVVAAVVFSRLTGFQPGIVFGLVAGVSFGALLAPQQARVTLTGLAYGLGAAVIGWVGYSLLVASGNEDFGVVFVRETMSAMAVGGIAALPIALFPLRGLAGHDIFVWNRVAWAGAYAVGLFGFFFVLMPMPFAWTGVPLSLGTWITLYLLYAVLAVGSWLAVVRPWVRVAPEEA